MRAILADADSPAHPALMRALARHPEGIAVIGASSLTEVLRALVEHHPVRLAVLDLAIAGMGGFQGLAAVRRLFPDVRCLLVSTTGHDRVTVMEAMRQGAHGVVSAQAAEADLSEAIGRVLAGESYLPATASPPSPPPLHDALAANLTPRERDIVLLLREGLPNKAIANRLAVSEVTVKSHLGKVFRKLGVRNRLQALRIVVEAGPL